MVAGQHLVDADYFRRIDALNFAMAHDDGQLPQDLSTADIIILGISRTSKTPNQHLSGPARLQDRQPAAGARHRAPRGADANRTPAFVVGLVASPERIAEIRRNRVHLLADRNLDDYVDRDADRQRDRPLAPTVCAPRLAGHRRDAPLGGGDGCRPSSACCTIAKSGRRPRRETDDE